MSTINTVVILLAFVLHLATARPKVAVVDETQFSNPKSFDYNFDDDVKAYAEKDDIYDEVVPYLPRYVVHKNGKDIGYTQVPIVTRKQPTWSTPPPRVTKGYADWSTPTIPLFAHRASKQAWIQTRNILIKRLEEKLRNQPYTTQSPTTTRATRPRTTTHRRTTTTPLPTTTTTTRRPTTSRTPRPQQQYTLRYKQTYVPKHRWTTRRPWTRRTLKYKYSSRWTTTKHPSYFRASAAQETTTGQQQTVRWSNTPKTAWYTTPSTAWPSRWVEGIASAESIPTLGIYTTRTMPITTTPTTSARTTSPQPTTTLPPSTTSTQQATTTYVTTTQPSSSTIAQSPSTSVALQWQSTTELTTVTKFHPKKSSIRTIARSIDSSPIPKPPIIKAGNTPYKGPTYDCRILDPETDGKPSSLNDPTCKLSLPGFSADGKCRCVYEVDHRDERGCATGYLFTCTRK